MYTTLRRRPNGLMVARVLSRPGVAWCDSMSPSIFISPPSPASPCQACTASPSTSGRLPGCSSVISLVRTLWYVTLPSASRLISHELAGGSHCVLLVLLLWKYRVPSSVVWTVQSFLACMLACTALTGMAEAMTAARWVLYLSLVMATMHE